MLARIFIFVAVISCCSITLAQEKTEDPPRLFRGGLIKRFENLQERLQKEREERQKEREKAEKAKREAERKKDAAKKSEKKNNSSKRSIADSEKPESSRRLSPSPDPELEMANELAPNTDFASQSSSSKNVSLGIEIDPSGKGSGRIANNGLTIATIDPKGPAASAGLKKADRIVSVGSSPIKNGEDLRLILEAFEPGDRTEIEYVRKSKKQKTIVEFPADLSSTKRVTNGSNLGPNNRIGLNPPSLQSSSSRGAEELPTPNGTNTSPTKNRNGNLSLSRPNSNQNQTPRPQNAKATGEFRAGLGITALSITPTLFAQQRLSVRQGAYAEVINKGSAAEKAGLKTGIVVIAVDGRKVDSAVSLSEIVQMYKPGETAQILYYDGSRLKRTAVKLDAIPVTELTPLDRFGNLIPNGKQTPLASGSQDPNSQPTNRPNSILGSFADDFPRLKKIDDMIGRFTPEPTPKGSSVEVNRNGVLKNREAELENEVLSLRNKVQGQDQQIKTLTEKLNAIEKLLGRNKK